jgi:hypothetical protein
MGENTQWRGSEAPPMRELCWSGMDPLELPLLAVLKEAGLAQFFGWGGAASKNARSDSCFQSSSDHVQLFAIGGFPLKYHHAGCSLTPPPGALGQWTKVGKGGKGGIDRQRRSTPHRAIRLDLSRSRASESADMAPYTDFSPWDKVFFRLFSTHERPKV